MGQKIITEKDFWICTMGAVPAQLQSTQLVTYKQSGEKYVTIRDKATCSWIDFGCTKYILLMALIAAVVVVGAIVIGVVTVATGGLGLVAIGAIAGLAGGLIGAVVGGLLCGQKMASRREWLLPKPDFKILGANTITGKSTMICPAGGTVKFAPNIKNWWQAAGIGALNYIIKLAESAAVGGMVGTVAPQIVPLFTGGATLAAPTVASVWANFAGSFGGVFGAIRGLSAVDQLPNRWAAGELNSVGDIGQTILFGGVPEVEFVHRVATGGSLSPSDALLLLYLVNIRAKAPTGEPVNSPNEETPNTPSEEQTSPHEEEPAAHEEEEIAPPSGESNAETSGSGNQGEFEAFEDSAISQSTDQIQSDIIEGVTNDKIGLNTTARKGNFGEMVTDMDLSNRGWEPLHERITDIDAPTTNGIDGVYRNPNPPPEFIVVDAKYGQAQLDTLTDGTRQMSDDWIEPRLNDAVGEEMADEIRASGYERVVAKVDGKGNVTYRRVDADGYIIRGNAGRFTP